MGNVGPRVEVALPLPLPQTFTYSLSGPSPSPGTRVLVPFRKDEKVGWVVGPAGSEEISGVRNVLDVLDKKPSVSSDILSLAEWMAEYYLAPLGMVLRGALPSVLSDSSRDYLSQTVQVPDSSGSPVCW